MAGVLKTKYKKDLPFYDALFHRWLRSMKQMVSGQVIIDKSVSLRGDVKIGKGSCVDRNVILDGVEGEIEIGAFCTLAKGSVVKIRKAGVCIENKPSEIKIHDCCYIGDQTLIGDGAVIGEQCIIGKNSFVDRVLEPRGVYVGSPARRIADLRINGNDFQISYGREG